MPSVLRYIDCPACGDRHNFCSVREDLAPGREYEYICPATSKKSRLRPAAAGEIVDSAPQGAVELKPVVYDRAFQVEHPKQQGAVAPAAGHPPMGTSDPQAGPTRLQDVLPEINDLAGKVGGLEHLSDIVDNLKQPRG